MKVYLIRFFNKKGVIVKAYSMSEALSQVRGVVTSCERLITE